MITQLQLKYSTQNIIDFLKPLTGAIKITDESDIYNDLDMVGDDFHEMIEKYAKIFGVNMTNYLWYFHAEEEGVAFFGEIFFKPPY